MNTAEFTENARSEHQLLAAVLDTAASNRSFCVGQALGCFFKAGASIQTVHALSGELQISSTGYGILQVPNSLVRGVFQALDVIGATLPEKPGGGGLNAHITVFRPEEIKEIGGADQISEWGRRFYYTLGPVQELAPDTWDDNAATMWMIQVKSRELERLRKSYGLSALPRKASKEMDFHITVAVRPRGVFSRGREVTKVALTKAEIQEAAAKTDTNPTEAQREAGNYAKGKLSWNGLQISIESPAGSVRSGVGKDGTPWRTEMKDHYGYIRRTESEADGDHLDVFIRNHSDDTGLESELVFVIDQYIDGKFDEHKIVLGCMNAEQAKETYDRNYQDDWKGFGAITPMTMTEFKDWAFNGDTSKPVEKKAGFGRLTENLVTAVRKCDVFRPRKLAEAFPSLLLGC